MMDIKRSTIISSPQPEFSSLLEQYGKELHIYLWRLLQNQLDAEDCLQEAYLRAFRAYDGTAQDSNYRAWLYKIATNVARTHMQKSQRQDRQQKFDPDQVEVDPLEKLSRAEQIERVLRGMERLSFRQRTAIMLRKYSDLSYEAIAEALECTPQAARAHVYQGLKRLRVILGAGNEDAGDGHE